MATLKDLGEYLDLSVTQVSRALNGHSDVNEKTRLRVQQAAKKLNYSPNIAARNLVSGRSGVIGLVSRVPVGEASDNYLDVIVGLSAQFAKHNRQFIIHIIDKNEDEIEAYRKLVNSGAIDGFVIVESIINDPRIAFLQEKSFPFVVHGRTPNENNFPYFDIDNYGVAYSLTEHLIKLGHKHIALINGLEGSCYSAARLKGYQAALATNRLPFYPHLLRSGGMYESLGVVSTVQLLTHTEIKPTAIIAGNILIARGVYKALDALKLDIPQHISVVAHDDVLPRFRASAFYPALTVTRSALENSWGPLAEYLCGSIDGVPLKKLQHVAPFEFMTRASTAAVNNTKP